MDYLRVYNCLMIKSKLSNRVKGQGTYYEAHHILPRSLGGDGYVSQYKKHPNVVLLTAKEHFLAHRLLCKIFPKSKSLRGAWWAMCNQEAPNQQRVYKPSSRSYEEAKQLFVESYSGVNHPLYNKGYLQMGENNPAYGKVQSEELRARKRESAIRTWSDPKLREEQSKRHKGRKHTPETLQKMKQPKSETHRQRIKQALTGKPLSEERKKKISEALKRRNEENRKLQSLDR